MANPAKIESIVESILTIDKDVFLLAFGPQGRVPRFRPGQFLHIALDSYDPSGGFWPESRVFSIASSPNDRFLKIIYSVKGRFTARMRDEIHVGKTVWLKLPFGDFVVEDRVEATQSIVLIAGGTGISPFLPLLEKRSTDSTGLSPAWLFWGVRSSKVLEPRDAVMRCVSSGAIRATVAFEDGIVGEMDPRIEMQVGQLNIVRIREETRVMRQPVFFLSGPPAMIQAFKGYLLGDGVEPSHVIIDEWE